MAEHEHDDLLAGLCAQILDHLAELHRELRGAPLRFETIEASQAGDTVVVGNVVGRIQVISYALVAKAAVDVVWRSGLRPVSGVLGLGAGGAVALAGSRQNPLLETDPGEELVLNLAGAVVVGGHVAYVEAFHRG